MIPPSLGTIGVNRLFIRVNTLFRGVNRLFLTVGDTAVPLGRCPSLTHLRLASLPGLTGGIPATLGDCESLCSLVLSYNKGERGEGRRELETYG